MEKLENIDPNKVYCLSRDEATLTEIVYIHKLFELNKLYALGNSTSYRIDNNKINFDYALLRNHVWLALSNGIPKDNNIVVKPPSFWIRELRKSLGLELKNKIIDNSKETSNTHLDNQLKTIENGKT